MSSQPIRIVLVEDHPAMRAGIRAFLEREPEFVIVAEGSDGAEALDLIRRHQPHLVVIDLQMPNLSGIEVMRQARREGIETRFLALTAHDDEVYVTGALQAGAHGYLLKSAGPAELIRAVRRVSSGKAVFDPRLSDSLVQALLMPTQPEPDAPHAQEPLSERELDVMRLVAEGRTNREIGARLGISERTVHSHLINIFAKLHVGSRVEAVMKCVRMGWVQITPSA